MNFSYDLQTLRGDVFGGITAAVVGLPVALAFGVASGLGAVAGIYGAIAVGFFAAVFGGTRSQISGPTGPMAVAMAVIVTTHAESLAEAFTIAIMAGLIQILLGVLRIGRFVAYTPYSVISGFMSGIGVIIILLQTLPFLGAKVAEGGPLGAVKSWPDVIPDINFSAFAIAAVTLAVGVLWPNRLRQFLPPTLAALLAGTLLSVLWLDATLVFGVVPVIGDVPTRVAGYPAAGTCGRYSGQVGSAGADHCASGLHRQPAHLACSRCNDPHAAQPESGVDWTGYRQHGRGVHRRTTREPAQPWARW